MIYLVLIIIFSIILVGTIGALVYFKLDEKKLAEVTEDTLIRFGKTYGKVEFENALFQQYINILDGIQYENYSFLKDAVSDNIYNQVLENAKINRQKGCIDVISNVNKYFSKLIGFDKKGDLEVAKLWIKYSSVEFVKDREGNIVGGDSNSSLEHEYLLTFVRNRTRSEDVVCPGCGTQSHILLKSNCYRCDTVIVPKTLHWTFVHKEAVKFSKNSK